VVDDVEPHQEQSLPRALFAFGESALKLFEELTLALGDLLRGGNTNCDQFITPPVFAA
jgi:hypothetical protein